MRDVKTYKRSQFDRDEGTVSYYTSNHAPGWTGTVYSEDSGMLHLVLGDMGYHDVRIWSIEAAKAEGTLDELAVVFDETGAKEEILEIFETYMALRTRGAIQVAKLHQEMYSPAGDDEQARQDTLRSELQAERDRF